MRESDILQFQAGSTSKIIVLINKTFFTKPPGSALVVKSPGAGQSRPRGFKPHSHVIEYKINIKLIYNLHIRALKQNPGVPKENNRSHPAIALPNL
jgi:hypothetical protein